MYICVMKLLKNYQNIEETMKYLFLQIRDSFLYVSENIPHFTTPEGLYTWFKRNTRYINDTAGREVLQSAETLFTAGKNIHGISGAGDCDCFTIALVATMLVNGFKGINIYLSGRERISPVHIYTGCFYRGNRRILDLTEPSIDSERPYKFRQIININ